MGRKENIEKRKKKQKNKKKGKHGECYVFSIHQPCILTISADSGACAKKKKKMALHYKTGKNEKKQEWQLWQFLAGAPSPE